MSTQASAEAHRDGHAPCRAGEWRTLETGPQPARMIGPAVQPAATLRRRRTGRTASRPRVSESAAKRESGLPHASYTPSAIVDHWATMRSGMWLRRRAIPGPALAAGARSCVGPASAHRSRTPRPSGAGAVNTVATLRQTSTASDCSEKGRIRARVSPSATSARVRELMGNGPSRRAGPGCVHRRRAYPAFGVSGREAGARCQPAPGGLYSKCRGGEVNMIGGHRLARPARPRLRSEGGGAFESKGQARVSGPGAGGAG